MRVAFSAILPEIGLEEISVVRFIYFVKYKYVRELYRLNTPCSDRLFHVSGDGRYTVIESLPLLP